MMTLVISGSVIFALMLVTNGQQLSQLWEGSGADVAGNAPPSIDDYVNCPPDDSSLTDEDTLFIPNVAIEDVVYLDSNETAMELVTGENLTNARKQEWLDENLSSGDMEGITLINTNEIDSETMESRLSGFVDNDGDATVLTSPNYPDPYPNFVNSYESYSVTGGIGVQIMVHSVDLDHQTDFLYIRGGSVEDEDEKGPVLTGTIKEPMRFLVPHTTTFSVHFVSQHNGSEPQTHQGFRLSYSPFGTMATPTTPTTTEMIVPQDELQWARKEISLSPAMSQSSETWSLVRMALSNSTNAFIEQNQLKYKPSRPDDIRIHAQKCPDTWPKYEECVTLRFATPLRPIVPEVEDEPEGFGMDDKGKLKMKGFIPLTTTEAPEPEYQLSEANLEQMWTEFGSMALAELGIEVYQMPENSSVLLIWLTISLCIVAAFLFVLYSIWKIDFFKDYRRMSMLSRDTQDEDRGELKKKEFDISMFPSPHQIVPSLFPTGDPYSDRSTEYAYENATVNPWAAELNESHRDALNTSLVPKSQRNQQMFEPISPLEYSPSIVDFNEVPESRNNTNPFLSSNEGNFGQS
ncbi:uncharacterized protein LOC129778366 [Toxorhynchites rutilus septentrionalis]|uniref:uncharacterized protein LOC129778366 n=1 Tax=Toxorhynchites rutilus septentrionalis TaxID=329112 RepID=UPI002479D094|nr:uncharacterized protein LOC129778366 [Toxorhynchites rutilus septentrionalis]